METRRKKKIDYNEMRAEEEYKPEKAPPSTSKGKKRKNDAGTTFTRISKSIRRDSEFDDCDRAANWEEVTIKEEVLNSDSDDVQSEDEDIENQMESATDFLQLPFQDFNSSKPILRKRYFDDIKLPIDIYTTKNSKIGDICSLINYVNGYLKILLNGHVYFCNRVVDNVFYWQCDQNRDCISQAVTMYNDDTHSIKSLDEHIHPPTVEGNSCLKDNTIAMFLPAGIRQNTFEKCDVKKEQFLMRNGYFYIRKKTEEDIDFWLCEGYKSQGCKGGILTIKYEDEYYVKYASEHNHVNDLERQYRCHFNEEELSINVSDMFNTDQEEMNGADLNEEMNEFNDADNFDDYNDPDDSDYELPSDQENDDSIIKKEIVSDDEEDIDRNDTKSSKEGLNDIVCDFIKSQRGNPKLCINGYMYTLNRKSKSSYWTCEFKKKKSIACRAMACTAEREDGKHIVKKMTEHNHPPRTDRKIIGQILNRIREKCIERIDLTASEIVESEVDSLPEELRSALPSRNAIYRMISRKRRLEEVALGGSKIYERKEVKKLKNDLDVETSFEVKDPIICQTVESSRGSNKLIVDDYLFNLSRVAGENHYWRCEQRLSQKCVGFAITCCKNGIHLLKNIREHNHESQRNRKFVVQAMNKIKEMALKTEEDATVIVEDALKDVTEDVLRELPTKETLIRKVNRTRYLYKPKPVEEETTNKDEPVDEKSHIYDVGIEIGTTCELFSPTNKGNFKLNLNGYFYHKNRINNGMHYWQCEDNKHYKCKGFAVTVCKDDNQHILKKAKKHNHPAKESRQDITQIIQKIKEKAKTTDEDSSLIYNDEVEHLPDEIKNLLPQRCSILSMINRIRKQHSDGDDKKEPIKYDEGHEHIYEIKQLPDTECEFVESKRGYEKLTIEGYLYTPVGARVEKGIQPWRCNVNTHGVTDICRGFAHTYIRLTDGKHVLKKTGKHNHLPNKTQLEVYRFLNRMKQRVIAESPYPCRNIFSEEMAHCTKEVLDRLPQPKALLRNMYRTRQLYCGNDAENQKTQTRKPQKNNDSSQSITNIITTNLNRHVHDPFIEPETEIKINFTKSGAMQIDLNGFLLSKKDCGDNSITYWRCIRKVSLNCRGAASTFERNGKCFIRTTTPHSHLPIDVTKSKQGYAPEVQEVLRRMRIRMIETMDSPDIIYKSVMASLPPDILAIMPIRGRIMQSLKNAEKREKMKKLKQSDSQLSLNATDNELKAKEIPSTSKQCL